VTSRLTCLAALLIATAPSAAAAQFTTAVTPPRRPQPRPVAAVVDTVPRAQLDTVRPTVLSDLKAWVDSAANALSVPSAGARTTPSDSLPERRTEKRPPEPRATPSRSEPPRPAPTRPDSAGQRPPERYELD
jgi:hypothetical protein